MPEIRPSAEPIGEGYILKGCIINEIIEAVHVLVGFLIVGLFSGLDSVEVSPQEPMVRAKVRKIQRLPSE